MKDEKTFVVTPRMYVLYVKAQKVQDVLDKEVARVFFKDKEFIKALFNIHAEANASLWQVIKEVYPETRHNAWYCDGAVIRPRD